MGPVLKRVVIDLCKEGDPTWRFIAKSESGRDVVLFGANEIAFHLGTGDGDDVKEAVQGQLDLLDDVADVPPLDLGNGERKVKRIHVGTGGTAERAAKNLLDNWPKKVKPTKPTFVSMYNGNVIRFPLSFGEWFGGLDDVAFEYHKDKGAFNWRSSPLYLIVRRPGESNVVPQPEAKNPNSYTINMGRMKKACGYPSDTTIRFSVEEDGHKEQKFLTRVYKLTPVHITERKK